MSVVLFFLAFNLALVAGYVQTQWRRARMSTPEPEPRRLSDAHLRSFGIRQLAFTLILWLTYLRGDWTPESVGINASTFWLEAILAGEVGYFAILLVHSGLMWAAGRFGAMRLTAARGNLRVWPRGRRQKWLAALFIMVFNPFTEELVMRGILIHQWGLILGSAVAPIVIGFLLNGALHWYQGWRMQLWHALFFAMAVTLLYSPWGLTAAFAAHVLGDVLPTVHIRRNLLAARKARRTAAAR
jgi:membrane protease YdiL (CAAX protease family)